VGVVVTRQTAYSGEVVWYRSEATLVGFYLSEVDHMRVKRWVKFGLKL
jgi:hypothetical protein